MKGTEKKITNPKIGRALALLFSPPRPWTGPPRGRSMNKSAFHLRLKQSLESRRVHLAHISLSHLLILIQLKLP